ncbi:MAG: tetratricopeptide repeat protein, partial [Elusimicrobiales bacterium]|nr:tetratricopeptide repeat protein [Elusimicrobiales bacterium]
MRRFYIILLFLLIQSRPCPAQTAYDLYLKGDLSKAASAYFQDAAQDPASAGPLLNASMCLKQAGRYYEAAAALTRALEREPHNSDIYSELGWLRFHLADYAGASSAFETAIRIQELHPRAELGLASVYANLEQKEKALAHLEKFRRLRPDFAGVDYILAWNYMNFKMYGAAEEALIEALRKDPSFTEARLPLAGIYARQAKFNEAWNQYYRVLDYAPGHPVASKMMKVLEGKLTKQPEEIRPPFRITRPLVMEPLDAPESLSSSVKVRVGIGTTNTGKQGRNNLLRIKSFEGLTVTGKASGKVFARIPPDEAWTALYEDGKVLLRDPAGLVYGRFTGTLLVKPAARGGSVIFDASSRTSNPWFRGAD